MARKIVLILGLFVALLPYLGFPEALDTTLYSVSGLLIAFLAWSGKRPTPPASIEEMEGELHDATRENGTQQSTVKDIVKETPGLQASGVTLSSAIHTQEKQAEAILEPTEASDKTVSVAFAKHRSRNLKKRITQEEVTQAS